GPSVGAGGPPTRRVSNGLTRSAFGARDWGGQDEDARLTPPDTWHRRSGVRLRAPVRRWRGVRDGVENEGEPRGYVMAAGGGGGRAGGGARRGGGVRDGVETEGEPRGYVMAAGAGGGRAGGSLDAVGAATSPLTGRRAV